MADAGKGPTADYNLLSEPVKLAKMKLSPGVWDYLIGGSETETTLKRNRQAIDSIAFRPRVLRDMNNIDPSITLNGKKIRLPVFTCPIGGMERFDEGGSTVVSKATARFGIPMMLSSVCMPGIEQTADAAPDGIRYFQIYVRGDQSWLEDVVNRIIAKNYSMFVFTVDSAIYSRRERDLGKRYYPRGRSNPLPQQEGYQGAVTWDTVKRVKDKFKLPIGLKGIATSEDAEMAVKAGIDVVYVSNHGGRQLDHGLGAIEVLPEVLDAVGGKAQVYVDGGFQRGTDIVKAMAMGATAVGIGRAYAYGMAANGEGGVYRVLEIIEDEIKSALGLLGCHNFADLNKSHICKTTPVREASQFSAYNLLNLEDPGYTGR